MPIREMALLLLILKAAHRVNRKEEGRLRHL